MVPQLCATSLFFLRVSRFLLCCCCAYTLCKNSANKSIELLQCFEYMQTRYHSNNMYDFFPFALLLIRGHEIVYWLKHQTIEFTSPTSAKHTRIHPTHTHSRTPYTVRTLIYVHLRWRAHTMDPIDIPNKRSKHNRQTNSATAKRRTKTITMTTITMTTNKVRPAWLLPVTSNPFNQPYRITMAAVVAHYQCELPNRYLRKPNP